MVTHIRVFSDSVTIHKYTEVKKKKCIFIPCIFVICLQRTNKCTYFSIVLFYSAAPTCFDTCVSSSGSSSVPAGLHANRMQWLIRLGVISCYVSVMWRPGMHRSEIVTHHVTRHNMPIHNILQTAPQLSISQKALGTLPGDGNVLPKHVGATIHN
jgi:hypothetical protein